jgi:hypothetical protein
MRDRAYAITTRLVAENGLYEPASVAGAGFAEFGDGIIYRPGGVAEGNVFTTWPQIITALNATNGATTVYVDSSIVSPAVVPPGTYEGFGCAKLAPYNWRVNPMTLVGTDFDVLFISDGATLHRWRGVEGPLTVQCQCLTTQAFSFDYSNPNELDVFLLTFGGTVIMEPGAAVSAIQIPPGASLAIFDFYGASLSAETPLVAPVDLLGDVASPSLLDLVVIATMNNLGPTISGGAGNTLRFSHDDTITALDLALYTGTVDETKLSNPGNASSGFPFPPAGYAPLADGAGNIVWETAADGSYNPAVPANWAGAPPTTIQEALDRIAANTTNTHPIP